MSEPMPCPHCGLPGEVREMPNWDCSTAGYYVECPSEDCYREYWGTRDGAVEAWNRRAGEDALRAEVERLSADLAEALRGAVNAPTSDVVQHGIVDVRPTEKERGRE